MAIMKEETQAQYLERHKIPADELPPGISRGWRFAGEPSTSKPVEITEIIQAEEPFPVDMPPEDYLDYYDREEDLEYQDFLMSDVGWFWFQFLEEIAMREENSVMANKATIDWLRAREAMNDLFTGTHKGRTRKRRERQDFRGTKGNHQWYGGKTANDRDERRQSRIKDWGDDVSTIELSQDESLSRPGSDHEDFDWEAFNAEGDSGLTISVRSQEPVDERDTDEFQRVEQFMRHNAPRHTPGKRAIR